MTVKLALFSGFLGAGKTTIIAKLASALIHGGEQVAVITNDQGSKLVDTKYLDSVGIPTAEVNGGCFCCNFSELENTVLEVIETVRPSLILAEAVGSCTDLVATVHRPMSVRLRSDIEMLPLTVVVDIALVDGWLEANNAPWPWEVGYLFVKQLQEADILVLNQTDKVSEYVVSDSLKKLRYHNSEAILVPCSALTGTGLDAWMGTVLGDSPLVHSEKRTLEDINYDVYAAAEAQLGWLNSTFTVTGEGALVDSGGSVSKPFHYELAEAIQRRFTQSKIALAHAKLFVNHEGRICKAALTSTHRSWDWVDRIPEDKSKTDANPVQSYEIIANIRALAQPSWLEAEFRAVVQETCKKRNAQANYQRLDCFTPSYPTPAHRMA